MAERQHDIHECPEALFLVTSGTSRYIETARPCLPPSDEPVSDGPMNKLFYGDNLDILRQTIRDETIDLCYIDPPFNSKRNYYQIYNNIGGEDPALAQAFVDTWTWGEQAQSGFDEITSNDQGRFQPQTIEFIKGLRSVLKEGGLLAYLVSMTLRVVEIHRVLKSTGSFYMHCDPTSSHYLKLVIDTIFLPGGGDFRNEIIWGYESGGRSKKDFGSKHDVIFRYTKSMQWVFDAGAILLARAATRHNHMKRGIDSDGRPFGSIKSNGKIYKYYDDEGVIPSDVWTDVSHLQQKDPERRGYPTQKPEALLERIIAASSNAGDIVLDAYCGCGTSVAVAQRLNRQWIGIDITYQAIVVILKRLEDQQGNEVATPIQLSGVPRDMESAVALANKIDDRVRKEFEKWAVLTYTNNRAMVNKKKVLMGESTVRYTSAPGLMKMRPWCFR
jgi:DNA modification methylase